MGSAAVVVLDTHAWVWLVDRPDRIPPRARRLIEEAGQEANVYVSSISVWEVFMLAERNRLELRIPVDQWVRRNEELSFLRFHPVDNRIAGSSVQLPSFPHQDPADRMIVATARSLGATLITRDRRMLDYSGVQALWE